MTQRNQIVIGVVAAVAIVAAYWMLVLSPKREEASALSAEIEQVQTDLAAAQTQLVQFRAAKDSYKTNYATVARLGKAVPEDDDVQSLVVQLDSAAARTKVDFRRIQIGSAAGAATTAAPADAAATPPPGATVGDAGFMTMPFTFDFEGKFFRLSEFMSELERFVALRNDRIDVTGRLLVLDSLSLEPSQDGFPSIDAEIGATSYLLPPTQGLTGGATAAGPAPVSAPATSGSSAGSAATSTTATVTGVK